MDHAKSRTTNNSEKKTPDNLSSTQEEKVRLILVRGNHSDGGKIHEPESQFMRYIPTGFSKLA